MRILKYICAIVGFYFVGADSLQGLLLDNNEIKGTYDCIQTKDQIYAPFNGWIWANGGITEKYYRFGPLETTKDNYGVVIATGNGDATIKLTHMLFHAVEHDFRPTHNLFQAATYWNAAFIGALLNHIRKALTNDSDPQTLEQELMVLLQNQSKLPPPDTFKIPGTNNVLNPSQALSFIHDRLKEIGLATSDNKNATGAKINNPRLHKWVGVGLKPTNPSDVLTWIESLRSIQESGRPLFEKLNFFETPSLKLDEDEPFIRLERKIWQFYKDKAVYKEEFRKKILCDSYTQLTKLFKATGVTKENIQKTPLYMFLALDINPKNVPALEERFLKVREEIKGKSFSDIFDRLQVPDSALETKPLLRLRNFLWIFYKQLKAQSLRETNMMKEKRKKAAEQVPELAKVIVQSYQEAGQFLSEEQKNSDYIKKYPLHTPTMILLSFLMYKIEKKEELNEYFKAFSPSILNNTYEEMLNQKFSSIDSIDFSSFFNANTNEIKINDYERICFTLIQGRETGKKLPPFLKHIDNMAPAQAEEKQDTKSADCAENAVLNLVRTFLVSLGCISESENKKYFDLSQLPKKLLSLFNDENITEENIKKRIQPLTNFFSHEKIKKISIDSNDQFLHQYWTDTVASNRPNVKYLRCFNKKTNDRGNRFDAYFKKPFVHQTSTTYNHEVTQRSNDYFLYELAGYPSSYVEIVNYLFGTQFKTFKDMCDFFGISSSQDLTEISDDAIYKKESGFVPFKCLIDKVTVPFHISFTVGHTEMGTPVHDVPSGQEARYILEPFKKALKNSLFKGNNKHDFRLQNILGCFPTMFSFYNENCGDDGSFATIKTWKIDKKANSITFLNSTMRFLCLIQNLFPVDRYSTISRTIFGAHNGIKKLEKKIPSFDTHDLRNFLEVFVIKHMENLVLLYPDNENTKKLLHEIGDNEYIPHLYKHCFMHFLFSPYSKEHKHTIMEIFIRTMWKWLGDLKVKSIINMLYALIEASENEGGCYDDLFKFFKDIINKCKDNLDPKIFYNTNNELNEHGKKFLKIYTKTIINAENVNENLKKTLKDIFAYKKPMPEKRMKKVDDDFDTNSHN